VCCVLVRVRVRVRVLVVVLPQLVFVRTSRFQILARGRALKVGAGCTLAAAIGVQRL
jgi:hypothetical protein